MPTKTTESDAAPLDIPAGFSDLLTAPIDDFEAPIPIPEGGYVFLIGQPKFDRSSQKKTPFVQFPMVPQEPLPDVDIEKLRESLGDKSLSSIESKLDFYITPDALYRLKEFARDHVKVAGDGLSTQEIIQSCVGQTVVGNVKHTPSTKDPSKVYANIDTTAPVPG